MTKIYNVFLLLGFLMVGTIAFSSCNDAARKGQGNKNDSMQENVESFNDQVQDFDSSWQVRLQNLNESISQWDSTAKTYKGSLQDRMEKHITKAKQQRDSLKEKLDHLQDQSEAGWDSFRSSVREQYSDAVESMKKVGQELNR